MADVRLQRHTVRHSLSNELREDERRTLDSEFLVIHEGTGQFAVYRRVPVGRYATLREAKRAIWTDRYHEGRRTWKMGNDYDDHTSIIFDTALKMPPDLFIQQALEECETEEQEEW